MFVSRRLIPMVFIAATLVLSSVATAQSKRIALLPVGGTSGAKATRAVASSLRAEIGKMTATSVISAKKLRKATGSLLASCDGATECLTKIGRKSGSSHVVYAEVGGLGAAHIVYLTVTDSASGKLVRSTTLEFKSEIPTPQLVRAACYRLLNPRRYSGYLAPKIDVDGASIFVDGRKLSTSPTKRIALTVGSHAIRVTHPEFRDFVRFVEISFEGTAPLKVGLQQFPVVASEIRKDAPKPLTIPPVGPAGPPEPNAWYQHWYSVAGIGAAALVTGVVVGAMFADGINPDREFSIDLPNR